jgi:hypothetical protein
MKPAQRPPGNEDSPFEYTDPSQRRSVATVNHVRTIVVQSGESSALMRYKRRCDHGFPQTFPQFL